ncbi:hypothetical protein [Streptomyces lateritius]|nr:hypothetical protein [Streptomyces lateritius]MBX9421489.1 hypothetical protein [Streptomyces lateritius]OKJ66254.1 hypothetical protein AMK29_16430 [Streptomyces sp. CB02261]
MPLDRQPRQRSKTTAEVLIGSVMLPFPLSNDPVLKRQRQAQENPYDVLKHYGYRRNVSWQETPTPPAPVPGPPRPQSGKGERGWPGR